MVVSSFGKNFGNSIKTRPPLAVLAICLMGIIITTLSLAYYVHTKDRILNTDVKQDWLSLLNFFNKMDVCLEENQPAASQTKTETVSISSKASLRVPSLKESVNVQGLIPLKGWSSNCPDQSNVPTYLHISFSIPNSNNTKDICVTLTGPSDFVPKFLNNHKICEPVVKQGAKWKTITAGEANSNEGFCVNGLSAKLTYNIDSYKGVKFDSFLSMEDRLIINYNLIAASSFLLMVVICLTCYAVCSTKSTTVTDSTQYLMARGV